MTDFADWQGPTANAAQIKATGVPLIAKSVTVSAPNSQQVGPQADYASAVTDIAGTGYEILVNAQVPSSAATPFAQVTLNWIDSTSGVTVWRDYWIMPAAEPTSKFVIYGHGPSKADQVQVVVTNLDSAETMTIEYWLLGNGRSYSKDDWRWDNYTNSLVTVPGWTLATLPNDPSYLGAVNGITLAAGASSTYLFGMYNGPLIIVSDVTAGALSDLVLNITPQPGSSFTPNNTVFGAATPAAAQQLAGPRAPLRVIAHNVGSSSLTVTLGLLAAG